MPSTDAALEIETRAQEPVPLHVRASGAWTFNGLKERRDEIVRRLADLEKQPAERIAWDLSGVLALDDAGAIWLANAMRGGPHVEIAPRYREMLQQVNQGLLVRREPRKFDPLWAVAAVGENAIAELKAVLAAGSA